MKYDVFISYSSQDQKIVEGLCAYLEQHKIRCFVAYRDIPRGVVWARAIVDALDESRMMLVVFSEHFNNSDQVDREIELASEAKKTILTFRISDETFKGAKKYYLKNLNWIDAFPDPQAVFGDVAVNVARLLDIRLNINVGQHKYENIQFDRTVYDVFISKVGANTLEVVNCVKKLTDLSMGDSFGIVDSVPCFIKHGVTEQEAMSVKRALEAVGVDVEIFKRGVLPKYDVLISKVGINRPQVVQCVRMLTNLPLEDSKEIVYRVPSFIKEGVTEQDAMSAKRALEAVGVGVEIFVDKTSWDVYLKSSGPVKLQVVKVIKDTMGLTLSEALQTVNNAPCYVARKMSKSAATKFVKLLLDAVAEVELR